MGVGPKESKARCSTSVRESLKGDMGGASESGAGDEGKIHFARGYPFALDGGSLFLLLSQAQVTFA